MPLGFLGGRGRFGRCPGVSCIQMHILYLHVKLPRNRAAPASTAQVCGMLQVPREDPGLQPSIAKNFLQKLNLVRFHL